MGEGDGVAIMVRNHRGFVDALIGAAKLGADILFLNTAFAGPQLVEVLERDKPVVVVHDEEFADMVGEADVEHTAPGLDRRRPAATPPPWSPLLEGHPGDDLPAPDRHARIIILTSGTTGTPKGAPRSEAGVSAAVSLLDAMPLRVGWRTHIAAPLFHTWGFAHLALSMLLGSTMVLQRKFDPENCLDVRRAGEVRVAGGHPGDAAAHPGPARRAPRRRTTCTRLKVVASSGSALPGDLATTWMDRFGDNLYSTYGSTEVAYASIARPADLRDRALLRGPAGARHDREDPRRPGRGACPRASPAGSSWATACSSRATPAAATRTWSTA